MNSHQRRQAWRRKERSTRGPTPPILVKDWADLAALPDSPTHHLEIDLEDGCGWIHELAPSKPARPVYLSTHTFYGGNYRESTLRLRRCGFNVTCANWDAPAKKKKP